MRRSPSPERRDRRANGSLREGQVVVAGIEDFENLGEVNRVLRENDGFVPKNEDLERVAAMGLAFMENEGFVPKGESAAAMGLVRELCELVEFWYHVSCRADLGVGEALYAREVDALVVTALRGSFPGAAELALLTVWNKARFRREYVGQALENGVVEAVRCFRSEDLVEMGVKVEVLGVFVEALPDECVGWILEEVRELVLGSDRYNTGRCLKVLVCAAERGANVFDDELVRFVAACATDSAFPRKWRLRCVEIMERLVDSDRSFLDRCQRETIPEKLISNEDVMFHGSLRFLMKILPLVPAAYAEQLLDALHNLDIRDLVFEDATEWLAFLSFLERTGFTHHASFFAAIPWLHDFLASAKELDLSP